MKRILLLLVLIITGSYAYPQSKPSYPAPKDGYKRIDLMLPTIDNETDYKVEVKFAMIISMSECEEGSFSFILDNLKTKYGISPSRFPYYVLEKSKGDINIAKKSDCDSNNIKVNKKILSAQNIFIEYQSSYPKPFYIPESWTLEYRIWAASDYISIDN